MIGADAIIKCLEAEGVSTVFGYPGVAICPFFNSILDSDIKTVLIRTEQNAAHAASGVARMTGRPGVCAVTSGPGATNVITGIATAFADSIPMICITGQVNRKASMELQEAFSHKILRHICNSAGIERFPGAQFDMVRLGIGLYGVNPIDNSIMNNVSTLKTTILQIRDVPEEDTVGYSRKGHLTRPSRIAALPIGYADGLNRHLGNGHAYCLVNGQRAAYVGNICMDVCMIDVTDIDCKEGDSVEIFGDHLPITVLSDVLETIPYEVLTSVSTRVKRIYYQD